MAADDVALAPGPSRSHHPEGILELVYITVLISLGVLAMFLMHVLGSLRRGSSHKLLHAVVLGAYTLSYSLVSYTLGLMQESQYYFHEFAVWAVCLLMLLGGTDNLMACRLDDVDNWKSFHAKHLFKGVVVVIILALYGADVPEFQKPLWAILSVNVLQSCVRINAMMMASKSNLLSKNVKPIVDHMKLDLDNPAEYDPVTMKGYKYIVSGEHVEKNNDKKDGNGSRVKEKVDNKKITTVEQIWECKGSLLSESEKNKGKDGNGSTDKNKVDHTKINTVEKIWECMGSMFSSSSERGADLKLKDICLSMALSKMLNRRFAGFKLYEAGLNKTYDFVLKGLLDGDKKNYYERAFRVIEVELGFVYDLYYTRYPFLYQKIRHFSLCLPVAMVSFCSWLTYELYKKHKKEADDIPMTATLCLMVVVTFLEALQLYLHMASDWFKVALIRGYVTRPYLQRSGSFAHMIIGLVLRLKAVRPWENKLGQYSLLDKYNSTRHKSNCVHYMTLFLVDRAGKGRKRGDPIKLSKQVKQAVINSLIESKGQLTNGARSLKDNGAHELLSWACAASKEMLIHSILVWHVATTICKNELDAEPAKGGKQIAVEESSIAVGIAAPSVQDSSAVASSLSQYCAYLVAFAPDLLPGHSFDSACILDKSIEDARTLLDDLGPNTMGEKCAELRGMTNTDDNDLPIIIQGARLASQLTAKIPNKKLQWKLLSDFWAEMMLYVAPCDDAQVRAHLEALARGGEFITHLWALLTHAGVLKPGERKRPVKPNHPVAPGASIDMD